MLTNEEKRVAVYSDVNRPTVPDEVTPDTPLESLNLNWREKDLPERERTKHVHRLHPYLGKFVPQLVEIFLRKYFRPGDTIYDPFCGSGTTLVEANALGMSAIGCDISEFNCLLSKVKTDKYDIPKMEREVRGILSRVSRYLDQMNANTRLGQLELPGEVELETNNPYLLDWFAPQTLKELLLYRSFIPDYDYQDLLKIILSRSARSARLTPHYDLDFPKEPQREPYYCHKHSRICSPVTGAFKFLSRYSADTIRRIKEFNFVRTDSLVKVICGDSRTVHLGCQIDGVITSPPYVGLIDYHEQHRYAYELLGLTDRRELEIGPAVEGTSEAAVQRYAHRMIEVFRNCAAHLRDGGSIIIVIGDKRNLYDHIVEEAGLTIIDRINRHVNRRTGRRSSEFYESVIIARI